MIIHGINESDKALLKADILELQAQGKKVLLSIGGANHPIVINTATQQTNFVYSLTNLVTEYNFDGIDIDIENTSLTFDVSETDFKNPTTPRIVNLINGIKEICDNFSTKKFMLTAAPETAYFRPDYNGSSKNGAYLPILHALRDHFTFIHPQFYNSGSCYGVDGELYYPGTPDFLVALSESLITGFDVKNINNEYSFFEGLRSDQVAMGLLASGSEGSGYMESAEINKALDYLIKGISFGGEYELMNQAGYPEFRGLMTWSINVDNNDHNYAFVNNAYDYFFGSESNRNPVATNDAATTRQDTAVTVNVLSNDTDANGDVLTISAIDTPQNGIAEIVLSSIVYTPQTGFTGIDTFNYTISDGNNGFDTGTVTITVNVHTGETYIITASVINIGGGSYPEFVQKMGGDILYKVGDRITFNGNAYESLINNNSWSPQDYPAGWKSIPNGAGNANGTISPDGETTVSEGQSKVFTITPDSGCVIKDVKVDGVSIGAESTYSFSNIYSDHSITAEFIENTTQNKSPVVIINAPLNNATIRQATLSPVTISVDAQDPDGSVETITINVNNQEFTGASASWTPSDFGTYIIAVTAVDDVIDNAFTSEN